MKSILTRLLAVMMSFALILPQVSAAQGIDPAARGLAVQAQTAIAGSNSRKKAVLLVMGQSTEQGPVLLSELTTHPEAFFSQRKPGFRVKRPSSVADRGSYWPAFEDGMWDYGYDFDVINAAVGGASILTHIVGYVQTRLNSTPYYQKRMGANFPDLGDFGDLYQISSKTFNVTAGRKRTAFSATPHGTTDTSGNSAYTDYVGFAQTSEVSASSAPDVSAIAVGGTVADGSLTLTRLPDRYNSEGTFYPGTPDTANGGATNYNLGGVLGERNAGYGFDPLGIIANAERMANYSNADVRILWFSQGQTDLGIGSTTYQRALMILANYFLRRGWIVVLGNTIYSGASSNSTTANYGNLVTATDAAISTLSGYYPGKVYRGANLYSVLGSSGNMGAQKFTGSVSGTTLTVSSLVANSGSGLEVGHTLWNGTTAVGTIVSQLSGTTGGVGTYQLSASATISSQTLITAGAWMQYDGIHYSGAAVSAAGSAIADSFKAFLPRWKAIGANDNERFPWIEKKRAA